GGAREVSRLEEGSEREPGQSVRARRGTVAVSAGTLVADHEPGGPAGGGLAPATRARLEALAYGLAGMALLGALWWIGGRIVAASEDLSAFADFAPGPAMKRLGQMLASGE